MSQKLQLKSDLTLEIAIQIARQSEMVKSQVIDHNSLASKDVEEVHSKKKPTNPRWKREKERKRIHLKSNVRRSVADAVSITQSLNTV